MQVQARYSTLFEVVTKVLATQSIDLLLSNRPETKNWNTTTSRRPFQFSAPEYESTPEMSPEQKLNPEPLTSGDSNFESAKGSPALELTGWGENSSPQTTRLGESSHPPIENLVERGPHHKQTQTKQIELIEGGPQIKFEETHDPLVESSYFTKPQPNPLYSPIENLFTAIQKHNQPITLRTITMAQPANGPKELNLNKPEAFNGNRDGFKEFLQNVEVYMDVNHEMYNNNLRKIVFVLSFMTTGSAATWKAQFIEEAYAKPAPTNPNDRLGTYTQFRKDLIKAFSMFDSVGDVLDKLWSLRKKTESIDEHIAKFKMLAAKSEIDTTNPLSIKLFKETLPWALMLQLMKLETLLKIIDDWYEWVASLDPHSTS
jgi:Ty3 transposon capsid-like protein